MDLMGRKMLIRGGAPFNAYTKELKDFCHQYAQHHSLGEYVRMVSEISDQVEQVAIEMSGKARSDPLQWASYTYPMLLCFGDITAAWRLLDMAVIANRYLDEGNTDPYYVGKVMQATYFVSVCLPMTMARLKTCTRDAREVVEIPDEAF